MIDNERLEKLRYDMGDNEAVRIQPPHRPRYSESRLDLNFCCASVSDGPGTFTSHQCFKRVRFRYGKYGYCGIHDPAAVKLRREERDRKWEEQWAMRRANAARQARDRDFRERCVEAVKQIASGHNDPRALCAEIMREYGDDYE